MADTQNTPKKEQPSWIPRFLEVYSQSGNVTLAAQASGIKRNAVYVYRRQNKTFAKEMDLARDEAVGILMGEAFLRAKKSSDTLMIFLLKSLDPETFGDKTKQEHSGEIVIRVKRGTNP